MAKQRRRLPLGDPPEVPVERPAPRRSVFEVIPWPTWIVLCAVGVVFLTDWGRKLIGLPPRGETVVDLGQGGPPPTKPPPLGPVPPAHEGPTTSAPSPPSLGQVLAREATVAGAISAVRDRMTDTDGAWAPVTRGLAVWIHARARLQDIEAVERTTVKLALKNPAANRGKVICASGVVGEIHQDEVAALGGLATDGEVVRFVASRSSGELVKGSYARFCGIFVGLYSYESVTGTTIHAVQAAGLFDLPENRQPAAVPK